MMSSLRARYRRPSNIKEPKLIIIASEGQKTEPDYFDELSSTENYGKSGVHVIPLRRVSSGSSPEQVLEHLDKAVQSYKLTRYDELWIIIDRDKWTDKELNDVADQCKRKNIFLAVSNPCFELWLLIHFTDISGYQDEKREIVCTGKSSLRDELQRALASNPMISFGMKVFMSNVPKAITNAKKIDLEPQDRWPLTIGTRVYLLVETIIKP